MGLPSVLLSPNSKKKKKKKKKKNQPGKTIIFQGMDSHIFSKRSFFYISRN